MQWAMLGEPEEYVSNVNVNTTCVCKQMYPNNYNGQTNNYNDHIGNSNGYVDSVALSNNKNEKSIGGIQLIQHNEHKIHTRSTTHCG